MLIVDFDGQRPAWQSQRLYPSQGSRPWRIFQFAVVVFLARHACHGALVGPASRPPLRLVAERHRNGRQAGYRPSRNSEWSSSSSFPEDAKPRRLVKKAILCTIFVLLNASGPILFDWVKRGHGGRFPFAVPALTFHAWAFAGLLGLGWSASKGVEGMRQLLRPDMLWRFFITTSLFTAGDMLSFMSIQHLDVGTFSLLGKSLAIVVTVLLSRLLLRKSQTRTQYSLVAATAVATVVFCRSEAAAREAWTQTSLVCGEGQLGLGLVQRASAVCLTSLAAVLQERLLTKRPGIPFLLQQSWMSCGAMAMSIFTLKFVHRLPFSALLDGFGNWQVLVLLFSYVASGLTAALMVKKLGAVAKALCVPIYLGGCYAYAVYTGSAVLTAQAVTAWFASTACILLYAVSKMVAISASNGPSGHRSEKGTDTETADGTDD